MIKNYLKITIRSIKQNKFISFINIFGLAIGMAACLLILQFIMFELSYDDFHENRENIYRVNYSKSVGSEKDFNAATCASGIGPAIKAEFPEIIEQSRLFRCIRTVLNYEDKSFRNDLIYYADPSFLSMFSFRMLVGDNDAALADPNSAVISAAAAKKYFGEKNPVGKTIQLSNRYDRHPINITGIFEDIPENSHIKFDVLVSLKTSTNRYGSYDNLATVFRGHLHYTFLQTNPGTDIPNLQNKLNRFAEVLQYDGEKWAFNLQQLGDIYLNSDLLFDMETGNSKIIYFLKVMAFLILLIAWTNYINLSTSKYMERAKEVGIRKVFGASRFMLFKQFLFESVLMNLVSLIIALILVDHLTPMLNEIIGKKISYSILTNYWLSISVLVLFSVGVVLAGWYPAIVLSAYKPVLILRGKIQKGKSASGMRFKKGLVCFQYVASIILVASTFMIYKQMEFMVNKNLGMEIEQILVVKAPVLSSDSLYFENTSAFRTELLKYPEVLNVARSYYIPGNDVRWRFPIKNVEGNSIKEITCSYIIIDENFFDTYQMKLLAGRYFSEDINSENGKIIINDTGAKRLGFTDPQSAVNRKIYEGRSEREIIGVIKDYHHTSLKDEIEPIIFSLTNRKKNFYSIRLNTANIAVTLPKIRDQWKELFPNNPFDFFFLDEYFNKQYKDDQQFGKIVGAFTILALLIACLGLLGLSSYTAIKRAKEIGIRKVLGANIPDIILLLSKEYAVMIFLSYIIAAPIVYFGINSWLENYSFRIEISYLVFVLPMLTVLTISLLTVGFQSMKSAFANPVDSLKNE